MTDTTQAAKADHFLALHRRGTPLLLPNAWDAGSARLFASLGFEAVATTSSGFAATLGRLDGSATRDEVLAHCRALTDATDIPISADYENAFAHTPAEVAASIALAVETGLAGCSIEDFSGDAVAPIYDAALAADRVAAAAEAAHRGPARVVLTARAENFLHGRPDLGDTIARLQSFQAAGADVLYAPGLSSVDEIRSVVSAVDLPVNVLAHAAAPSVAQLAELGVARISVGGALAWVSYGAVANAARELLEHGTYGYAALAAEGRAAARTAFGA